MGTTGHATGRCIIKKKFCTRTVLLPDGVGVCVGSSNLNLLLLSLLLSLLFLFDHECMAFFKTVVHVCEASMHLLHGMFCISQFRVVFLVHFQFGEEKLSVSSLADRVDPPVPVLHNVDLPNLPAHLRAQVSCLTFTAFTLQSYLLVAACLLG